VGKHNKSPRPSLSKNVDDEKSCVAHRLYSPALASRGDYLQKDHIEQCVVHCF